MKQVFRRILCKKWGEGYGEDIYLFTMKNPDGSMVELTNYGATIVSIVVPDKQQNLDNVALGFPTLQGYLNDSCYIGSTIGRYANRIANSRFMLDKILYQLEPNDSGNSNHGGLNGFNTKVFDYEINENTLSFMLFSKDGEGGYPGNLKLKVDYSWSDNHELSIVYTATSDKKTITNFTNHTYFNLTGGRRNILEHELSIDAKMILESAEGYMPTGTIIEAGAKGFSKNKIIEKITMENDSIMGLNDCYVLNKNNEVAVCSLFDSLSGRCLEVFTSYPGLVVYTGDYLNSSSPGHAGENYKPFDGISLECQYYPDSPNHSDFPGTVLEKGQQYNENILFKFSVKPA